MKSHSIERRLAEHFSDASPRVDPDSDLNRELFELIVDRAEFDASIESLVGANEVDGGRRGLNRRMVGVAAAVFAVVAGLAVVLVSNTPTSEVVSADPAASTSITSSVLPTDSRVEEADAQAGEQVRFEILPGQTVDQIIRNIAAAHPALDEAELHSVLQEGLVNSVLTPTDQSELSAAEGFRTIYEGLLAVGTYRVPTEFSATETLQAAATAMEENASTGRLNAGLQQLAEYGIDLSVYELLTVASLVEAETRVATDAPLIARVIYNRLEAGESLGLDHTVGYAVRKDDLNTITAQDLNSASPFNTRNPDNIGLPPTPTGAPSATAIAAALAPAEGDWLFYALADTDGSYTFSSTAAQFIQAIEVCRTRNLGC